MRVDNTTISEMFAILHDKVVVTGPPPKYIEFLDVGNNPICQIKFDDIVEDPSIPGEFYFEDPFGSRVIRGLVTAAAIASSFVIYDASLSEIVTGSVSLLNGSGDITFNAIDWSIGQVVIVSSLKIYFPTES